MSETSKHTPMPAGGPSLPLSKGEWFIAEVVGKYERTFDTRSWRVSARLPNGRGKEVALVYSDQDANVIVQAPAMYEALKELIDEDYKSGRPDHYQRTRKARDIVAAVEGKEMKP